MDLDEVALNTLLAEGIDVPTSFAGSIQDREIESEIRDSNMAHTLGVVVSLIVLLLLLFWLA
jgi:hypothetical protein